MKVHRLEIMVVDFDELGANEVVAELEGTRFANDCIHPRVKSIETRDIGEWHDDHPLNSGATSKAEFKRLFAPDQQNDLTKMREDAAILKQIADICGEGIKLGHTAHSMEAVKRYKAIDEILTYYWDRENVE